MSNEKSIIIVGGGLAGTFAAETLRKAGYLGRIILFDRDTEMPYDRPPLSKEYMLGEQTELDILLHAPSKYDELNIELELGTEIQTIDIENKKIISKDGRQFPWEKILLATGATLRELQIKGSNLKNIFYLRTMADAQKIKEELANIKKVVIVGAGFIGAELASVCIELGKEVTVIERAKLPMERIFGEEIGDYFLQLHQSNGVEVITNESLKAINGESKVDSVVTESGHIIECQAVIVGIGVDPNMALGHDLIEVDRGYIVDEFGETSVEDVFAAGDCTMWPYEGNHIHVEHWDHAVNHGKVVAENMLLEEKSSYDRVPYFWSDQYNRRIQYVGYSNDWSATVLRGDFKEGKFTYFYLDKVGAVQAAIIYNEPRNMRPVQRLIKSKKVINPTELQDVKKLLNKL